MIKIDTKQSKNLWRFTACSIVLVLSMILTACEGTLLEESPAVNASGISSVFGVTPTLSPTPAPSPAFSLTPPLITPEPVKDELGLALPEPDERGFRSYRWNGQLVNDSLGDFAEAAELRNLLLPLLDGPMKEDFYYIYLGGPHMLDEDNLLIPAGKRHDGEWMPALYHISRNEDGRLYICAYSFNYAWQITRSLFTTSNGDITTFFGVPAIIDYVVGLNERPLDPLRITLRFTDGSEVSDTLPDGSGYFLITAETGKTLAEIRVENVNTGETIPWNDMFAGSMWGNEGEDSTLGRV